MEVCWLSEVGEVSKISLLHLLHLLHLLAMKLFQIFFTKNILAGFFDDGFTMVEIVIMLGIIVMVSLVVLVNFPAVTETIFIQRSGQEISGLLRRAQSMSLAVRSARDPATGIIRVPRGVGVWFQNNAANMILFGELSFPPNYFYDAGVDAVIATYALERNLKTTLFTATRDPINELHVTFASPDASVRILGETPNDDVGQAEGRASVKIITPSLKFDRVVEVAITGQISVK